MEVGVALWQATSLLGLVGWVLLSSKMGLTRKVRSMVRPWITNRVQAEVPFILWVQGLSHGFLDVFFTVLSCAVSVPFYTGFLPVLFWSGHSKLARHMTLLIAFCDYLGNSIKDLLSAPRPSSPPIRRLAATTDEKENALEYGFPSSHALNTVCLTGYLIYYAVPNNGEGDETTIFIGFTFVLLVVSLISIARIYLGMHSVIDVLAGVVFGLVFLAFWITIHEDVDDFIIYGQNVTSFWAALSFVLLFAYPAPELPTPSFEFHTAFNGVALGIVSGVHQNYHQFHHEDVPRVLTTLSFPTFIQRVLVGIPTILIVKFCSKAVSKWLLPMTCNTLGIPIRSSSYIPTLRETCCNKDNTGIKPPPYVDIQKALAFIPQASFDVDTGIRFFQYAGLAWSVVDLVPSIFVHLRL